MKSKYQLKRKTRIVALGVVSLVAASCADFTNSRSPQTSDRPTTDITPVKTGKNPFPPGYENPNEGEFTEAKMLVNIGVNVVAKSVREFRLQSELLTDRVGAYCDALESGSSAASAEKSVRDQFRRTMLSYHSVDALPVGPLNDKGRYLADHLYAWPYLNACGIDLETIRYGETGVVNQQVYFSQRGLGAIEYLLFEDSLSTRCNPRANPKAIEWSQKSDLEKKSDRCSYAKILAADLRQKALELDAAWDVEGANFTKTLIDGSRYQTIKDATNDLSDALFSLEILKDMRLAKPLGRHKDCLANSRKCPEMAEHGFSNLALEAVESRLRSFKAGFFGSPNARAAAFGFDDLLKQKGHGEVAERILVNLERAEEALVKLQESGSFQSQIEAMSAERCAATTIDDRQEPLCALFQDVRKVTTAMKSEVLLILSLRAPPIFQGDND